MKPIILVCGDDDFAVKNRSREIFDTLQKDPAIEHETLDAGVTNVGDALKVLGRIQESLQTLPFFGSRKAVWIQNCSFLSDDRVGGSEAVTERLAELSNLFKSGKLTNVQVLISALKVDKRKSFFKTVDKLGMVETFTAASIDDKDWEGQSEATALAKFRESGTAISDEALAELILRVGPNVRNLYSEIEKLSLYSGDKKRIELDDVVRVVSKNKQAKGFALGEALGSRNAKKVMVCLDEEFWDMETNTQKSEIGILYGLISKVRTLLMCSEALRMGWLKPVANYAAIKNQMTAIPPGSFPENKKFNLAAQHPYVVFQALQQVKNYSQPELVRAMNLLLKANLDLISSSAEPMFVIQKALFEIVQKPAEPQLAT